MAMYTDNVVPFVLRKIERLVAQQLHAHAERGGAVSIRAEIEETRRRLRGARVSEEDLIREVERTVIGHAPVVRLDAHQMPENAWNSNSECDEAI